MFAEKEERTCLLCGKIFRGRSDKKFCDDYCRAAYNNDLKSAVNNYIRNVNNALGKNRRILESCLTGEAKTAQVSGEKLLQKGFQFKYHTHIYTTKSGNTYFYCYEYGFMPLEKGRFLVVRAPEENE
mgnify:CR=1 FL=1